MALEIERKFLIKKCINIKDLTTVPVEICQGYLSDNADATVRVRIYGEKAFLTVKSRDIASVRHEWEYEIPIKDAKEMLMLPNVKKLSKTRYKVNFSGHIWEIDVFHGNLEGLIMAEVELKRPDEELIIPDFIEREVSGNPAYYNSNLIKGNLIPR